MMPASDVPALIQTKMSIPETRQLGFAIVSCCIAARQRDEQLTMRTVKGPCVSASHCV
mgnify:FL=1